MPPVPTSPPTAPPLSTGATDAPAARTQIPDPHTRACFRLVLLSLAIGVVLRIVQYLHHNSYWNDEAALVLNILHRDFDDLLRPLDFAQAAPPLFLWVQRWIAVHFGSSEYALRALPALLGLAALPLYANLAWRLLRPAAAAWAVAWFAINDRIIPQVTEVKQYSDDLFFSTLLFFVAFGPARAASPVRRLARAAIVATVAIWFSFPSAIVFGGIVVGLLPQVLRRPRDVLRFIACTLPPLASAALLGRLVLTNPRDPYLNEFWANHFVNFARPITWLAGALFELGDYPFASLGVVVLFLAAIGFFALRNQGRQNFMLTALATLIIALVASALRIYPFGGSRVTLYLFPPLFLLVGAGAFPFTTLPLDHWLRRAWWVLPAPLLILAVAQCSAHSVRPVARSNIRPVVHYVHDHRNPDETIYLAGGGVLPQSRVSGRNVEFLCYWPDSETNIVRQMIPPEEITAKRFWVVYSLISSEKLSRLDPLLQRLAAIAEVKSRHQAGPAGAILYELRDAASTTRPTTTVAAPR
jgi:hypothetical protein